MQGSIYQSKLCSLDEAAGYIQPNDRIFYGYGTSCPMALLNAITRRLPELGHVDFFTGMNPFPVDYLYKPEYKDYFNHYSTFYFLAERFAKNRDKIDFFAYQFSRTESVFKDLLDCNVLLIECTPPDEEGFINYGPYGVCINDYLAEKADKIIVQVNENMPQVCGEGNRIHVSRVSHIIENSHPMINIPLPPVTDVDKKIAQNIVERINDGDTIQIGFGGLANAICSFLDSKKDLGIYSEMIVDAMVPLVEKGVITNSKKNFHPGEITCSLGGLVDATYRFVHKNEMVKMYPMGYVTDPNNVAKNDNMIAINNTIMADLTGQAGSETIGFTQYSGTGGQLDFVRGAMNAKGGHSYLAMPSTFETKEGKMESRILLELPPGEVVTVARTDADLIVTEFGAAELRNKTLTQRVKAMISIAHPQFREKLAAEAKQAGLLV